MQRRKLIPVDFGQNLQKYYGAISIIILGYIVLAIGDADSLTSRTLGPIIIVLGYLIAVPTALLSGVSEKEHDTMQPSDTHRQSSANTTP